MSNDSSTILAIDPGSRELGFAVLHGKSLLYYGVKTITDRKNPARVLETVSGFIRTLIKKYRPTDFAIEKMFLTQKNSALLAVVAEQIKAVARDGRLPIYEYAPKTIIKHLCQTGKATKREAAEVITKLFPELRRYLIRTKAWERDYYSNIFDAVAVALMCVNDLKNNENAKK